MKINGNEWCAVTGAIMVYLQHVEDTWLDGYKTMEGKLVGSFMWDDYARCVDILMREGFKPQSLKLRPIGAEVNPHGEA